MGKAFLARQAATLALTANAIRPLTGPRSGIPSFFAGWLTGELAPHVLGATAADALAHSVGVRRDPRGLALAGLSAAGLGYLIAQSRKAVHVAEECLTEGLGVDYVEQLDEKPAPGDLAVPLRTVANPFAFKRAARRLGVTVQKDIRYAPWGRRGMLDIYTSDQTPESGAPVLLQVHGGAWILSKKEEQGLPLMQHMAAKGWICVAINYRLAPRDAWPAQIEDVKRAIAWVRDNIADYGGDPHYIAITGGSAGGHLAALAALTPNDPAFQPGFEDKDTAVQAAIPHYGVYDLCGATGHRNVEVMRDHFLAKWVMQVPYAEAPQVYEQASPLRRVTPEAPDFFVVHGAVDTLVGVQQARALVERLKAVSRRTVVYAELPGTQHAFDVFPSIRSAHVVRAIERYLRWHWSVYRNERREVA